MKLPKLKRKIVTEASLSFTFTRRAMVVGGLQAGIGAMLIGRMGWISVAATRVWVWTSMTPGRTVRPASQRTLSPSS